VAIDPNNLSATATLTFSEEFNSFNLWNGTRGLDTRPGWAMWPQYDTGFTEAGMASRNGSFSRVTRKPPP